MTTITKPSSSPNSSPRSSARRQHFRSVLLLPLLVILTTWIIFASYQAPQEQAAAKKRQQEQQSSSTQRNAAAQPNSPVPQATSLFETTPKEKTTSMISPNQKMEAPQPVADTTKKALPEAPVVVLKEKSKQEEPPQKEKTEEKSQKQEKPSVPKEQQENANVKKDPKEPKSVENSVPKPPASKKEEPQKKATAPKPASPPSKEQEEEMQEVNSNDQQGDEEDEDEEDWTKTFVDAELRRPGGLLDHNPPSRFPRTMVLYILAQLNDYQVDKVNQMAQAFQQDFLVIWGNTDQPDCPKEITAIANCVDDWILSDSKRELTRHSCCGIQKAVAWSVSNRYAFDHVWMMEEDVHFTNITELTSVVRNQYPKDSHRRPYQKNADMVLQMDYVDLSQGNPIDWNKKWETRAQFWQDMRWMPKRYADQFHAFSMLNLFRVSRQFLTHVEMVFHDSQNQYGFFESFFPTLARRYEMTIDVWPYQVYEGRHTMVGPCWPGQFPIPGIYHPAKWNGTGWTEFCKGVSFDPKSILNMKKKKKKVE
uniref:Uncharacterized protein n=1 Tax=Entomoneis paludosa TaxID=265537 RepID=A0A7S2Y813_9STRA|mmetsp:Transcript_21551/g.44966  ORF Transcript_21551/g.44966 Transcript_21551/m.44966 type:complete len:536 (+) Transcript_21551:182-1789(+)